MTATDLRIRCATLDGTIPGRLEVYLKDALDPKMRSDACDCCDVPEYTKSIDAINAAVLRLSEEKRHQWLEALKVITESKAVYFWKPCFAIATASALDRAAAFAAIHSDK